MEPHIAGFHQRLQLVSSYVSKFMFHFSTHIGQQEHITLTTCVTRIVFRTLEEKVLLV